MNTNTLADGSYTIKENGVNQYGQQTWAVYNKKNIKLYTSSCIETAKQFANKFARTESLKGRQFKVDRYDCIWTVVCYERNNAWTCVEPDYHTTCQFYADEIITGLTA